MINDIKNINNTLDYFGNNSANRQSRLFLDEESQFSSVIGNLYNEKYWGVSPKFTVEKIYSDLIDYEENVLKDEDSFGAYIENNYQEYWKNHPNFNSSIEQSKAIFAQCILAMCHEFVVEIEIETEQLNMSFENILKELKIYYSRRNNSIYINGRLTDNQINELSRSGYYLYQNGKKIYLKENNENQLFWKELYKHLKCHVAFYSGVLTNVLKINKRDPSMGNNSVSRIETEIIGTTFATVLGTGHPKLSSEEGQIYKNYSLMEHPLLSRYRNEIDNYIITEKELQKNLFESFNMDMINFEVAINKYLQLTNYPVIISAAGNILTCDDELIYIKRGSNIEHGNKLSCAITGYMEIEDENVLFYEDCVDDDKPTIKYSDKKFNFSSEFSRESRAELGINILPGEWRYLGLIISGSNADNREKYVSTIDVEVMAQARTEYTVEKIRALGSQSIESSENENIFGYKMNIYSNVFDMIKDYVTTFLSKLNENKDLVILFALAIPMIFHLPTITLKDLSNFHIGMYIKENFKTVVELVLNVVIVIIFINSIIAFCKRSKYVKVVRINKEFLNKKPENILGKLGSGIKDQYTYLFLSMILMYFVNENNKND